MTFDPVRISKMARPSDAVPRDFDDNVLFRRSLRRWVDEETGDDDRERRLLDWLRVDALFWMDALVYTVDPRRHPGDAERPWISLPFQRDEVIPFLEDAMGDSWTPEGRDGQVGHDACIFKTRDVGGSVLLAALPTRRFICFSGQLFLYSSINEKSVDLPRNPNTMLGKIDLLLDPEHMPTFLTCAIRRDATEHLFERPGARSFIEGGGTTKQTARGMRPHAIIVDEFAAWELSKSVGFEQSSVSASSCRLFCSTAQGMGNGFHRVLTNPAIPKLVIHWTRHPWHAAGLYRVEAEKAVLLDHEFWEKTRVRWLKLKFPLLMPKLPKGVTEDALLREVYPFVTEAQPPRGKWDGVTRSCYYDHERLRYSSEWMAAQELDCDLVGSNNPFFDPGLIQAYLMKFGVAPYRRGELFQDQLTYDVLRWAESPTGRFWLWFHPVTTAGRLRPSESFPYCMGVDIGAGVGASPSVISVWRCDTGEKLLKYKRSDVRPSKWAEWSFTVQRWFGNCPIMFEGGGVGNDYGSRLVELGARDVYWMRGADGDRVKLPGWHYNQVMKRKMLNDYFEALISHRAVNRDIDAVSEGFQFQLTAGQGVEHASVANAATSADAEPNHGDDFMADGLAWLWMTENGYGQAESPSERIEDPREKKTRQHEREEREQRYAALHW